MEQIDVWDFGVMIDFWFQRRSNITLDNSKTYEVNLSLPKIPFKEKNKSSWFEKLILRHYLYWYKMFIMKMEMRRLQGKSGCR
jgi:hypothetical protein